MRFLFVIILLLQGCATAPMANLEKDSKAKTFETDPSISHLYIYRNENFGAAVSMDVLINNLLVGQTAAKTYFKFDLLPGNYQIQSKSENTSILDVTLDAGENYFVWQEVKLGLLYARTKLTLMTAEQGKKGVLESRLINTAISSQELSPKGVVVVSKKDDAASVKLNELKLLLEKGEITQAEHDLARTKILQDF